MKQPLHTFVCKAAAALLLTAAGTLPMLAAEPESPLSIIHPDWEYTYYNNYCSYCGPYSIYQKCGFTEEKEIDGNTYWLFTLLTETDKEGNPKERNVPLAYMREENGYVYMRLHPNTPHATGEYRHGDTYGHKHHDLLIYDFNLEKGNVYRIGEERGYPVFQMFPQYFKGFFTQYLMNIENLSPYSYLFMWDNGILRVADVKEDETLGRRIWFMHQKCTYPEEIYWPTAPSILLDDLDTNFDTTHTRTFRFVEGIGCLKSFLPFPGLFLPTYQSIATSYDHGGIPMLCEVKDKVTGEIIYKDDRRPDKDDSVNEIGAESNQKEYYNKEGIRTLNPEPGEICIVRRGAKVTKEVIAR